MQQCNRLPMVEGTSEAVLSGLGTSLKVLVGLGFSVQGFRGFREFQV